jgi:hypothetical protein
MACGFVPTDSGNAYAGWSCQAVRDELAKVDEALANQPAVGVGQLTGASLNGKSFTFSDPGGGSGGNSFTNLKLRKIELQKALQWCDPRFPGPSSKAVFVFKGGC